MAGEVNLNNAGVSQQPIISNNDLQVKIVAPQTPVAAAAAKAGVQLDVGSQVNISGTDKQLCDLLTTKINNANLQEPLKTSVLGALKTNDLKALQGFVDSNPSTLSEVGDILHDYANASDKNAYLNTLANGEATTPASTIAPAIAAPMMPSGAGAPSIPARAQDLTDSAGKLGEDTKDAAEKMSAEYTGKDKEKLADVDARLKKLNELKKETDDTYIKSRDVSRDAAAQEYEKQKMAKIKEVHGDLYTNDLEKLKNPAGKIQEAQKAESDKIFEKYSKVSESNKEKCDKSKHDAAAQEYVSDTKANKIGKSAADLKNAVGDFASENNLTKLYNKSNLVETVSEKVTPTLNNAKTLATTKRAYYNNILANYKIADTSKQTALKEAEEAEAEVKRIEEILRYTKETKAALDKQISAKEKERNDALTAITNGTVDSTTEKITFNGSNQAVKAAVDGKNKDIDAIAEKTKDIKDKFDADKFGEIKIEKDEVASKTALDANIAKITDIKEKKDIAIEAFNNEITAKEKDKEKITSRNTPDTDHGHEASTGGKSADGTSTSFGDTIGKFVNMATQLGNLYAMGQSLSAMNQLGNIGSGGIMAPLGLPQTLPVGGNINVPATPKLVNAAAQINALNETAAKSAAPYIGGLNLPGGQASLANFKKTAFSA